MKSSVAGWGTSLGRVAVVALLGLGLYGCPGDETGPGVDPGETDASVDATATDASSDALVADASADADAAVCTPPTASTDLLSDDCGIAGSCSTCAAGLEYTCTGKGGSGLPRGYDGNTLQGCRKLPSDPINGAARNCCPPACVRAEGADKNCLGNAKGYGEFYLCPGNADGSSKDGPPSQKCDFFTGAKNRDGFVAGFCCAKP